MDEIRCSVDFLPDETRQGPGRIVGTILRFGEQIVHTKGPEQFEARSLAFSDDGVVLYDSHDVEPRKPVHIFTPIQTDTEARIDALLPDTPAGRRLAERFRNGTYKGLSIEFRAVSERYVDGVRRVSKAFLGGVAAVESPAYQTPVEIRSKRSSREIYSWL